MVVSLGKLFACYLYGQCICLPKCLTFGVLIPMWFKEEKEESRGQLFSIIFNIKYSVM